MAKVHFASDLSPSTGIAAETAYISPDLQAFARDSENAATTEALKIVLVRALQRSGVQFLQLSNYRRLQFLGTEWFDFKGSATLGDVSADRPEPETIAARAIMTGETVHWSQPVNRDGRFGTASGEAKWLKSLHGLGILGGVTIAIHSPNDLCHVFHYGSASQNWQAAVRPDLGVYSAIAFTASRRLNWFERTVGVAAPCALRLSARELDVLRWCKDGKSYPEIAVILGISTKTVEYHISNAMRKLGVNQKISAIVVAAREGLIAL
jgi:DNA-binding CsgD family transcriptional regulator